MYNVMNSLLWISLYSFYINVEQNYLAENHLLIQEGTILDTEQKFSKCLLEIMTLVSSINNIGSDIEFVLRERSFIYVMNIGSIIYPWWTLYFNVPQSEKKFWVELADFTSTLSSIS